MLTTDVGSRSWAGYAELLVPRANAITARAVFPPIRGVDGPLTG
jgi:hypothetical protein